jgi:hypothetical protein
MLADATNVISMYPDDCCFYPSSAAPRLSTVCRASPPLSTLFVLFLACATRPQPPPGSLLFAVVIAFLIVCLVACRCCTTSATARLAAVGCSCPVRLSHCLQVLYDLSQRPFNYFRCRHRCPFRLLCCFNSCSSSATARLCTACSASPQLSFTTVLLLEGVARPQPPPGSLLFAVTIAVLSVWYVGCRCCSSSATAATAVFSDCLVT